MIHRSIQGRARAYLRAGCLVALALLPAPVAGQISSVDRDRGRTMLRQVRAQIQQRYYDAGYGRVDLKATAAQLDASIQGAQSLGEVFAAVAQMAMQMGDSHTYFVPPQQTVEVDYGWELMMVGDSAYVSEVSAGSDAHRQGVRTGDRVISVNGHAPTRHNLWAMQYAFRVIRPQPGLRVVLRAPGGEPRQLDLASRVRERFRIVDLTGGDGGGDIHALIRQSQNEAREMAPRFAEAGDGVLVWKLPTFDVEERAIREGLRRARGSRALVLDLRGNGGGPVDNLLTLVGGLSRDSVFVATERRRDGDRRLVARGAGDGAFTGPLVVLADSRSASASEVVARVVQLTGRGVVLGDRTSGAVMVGRMRGMSLGVERVVLYGINVSEGDVRMADGARLEGTGVAPDQTLLPGAAAMAAGEDPVLAAALARLGVTLAPAAAGALLRDQ
jgi:C-terminal processing protease CtpA/Prc